MGRARIPLVAWTEQNRSLRSQNVIRQLPVLWGSSAVGASETGARMVSRIFLRTMIFVVTKIFVQRHASLFLRLRQIRGQALVPQDCVFGTCPRPFDLDLPGNGCAPVGSQIPMKQVYRD